MPNVSNHGEAVCDSEGSSVDPVEEALAAAMGRASVAGNWDAVKVLASELRARRPQLDGPAKRPKGGRS